MKAAIISLGSESSKMIAKEMDNYFDEIDLLDIRGIEVSVGLGANGVLYRGDPIKKYDCVFIRGSFKYAAIQRSITSLIEDTCYMPYPAHVFSIVHDKILTHLELERKKIPMPKTYLTPTAKAAKSVLEQVKYPIIMKIPHGTQGKGVMFADSFPSANSVLDTLTTLKQPFLIQEFVETEGSDIRAFVVGNKVIACMRRKSGGDDKRSNLHAGGSAEKIEPDDSITKIALKTAQVLKAEICGIDILESSKGPLVIEANLSPGLQGITKATGINIAEKVAQHLAQKTAEFLKAKNGETVLSDLLEEEGIQDVEAKPHNMITTFDFRGTRVLLPEVVSKNFKEDEEYMLEFNKQQLYIKKMDS